MVCDYVSEFGKLILILPIYQYHMCQIQDPPGSDLKPLNYQDHECQRSKIHLSVIFNPLVIKIIIVDLGDKDPKTT